MTTAKHTPGPWALESETRSGGTERYVTTADGARTIMWTPGAAYSVDSDAELDANARLIASAPTILEALEDAARWIDTLPEDIRLGSIMPEKLRTIIQLARGDK